MMREVGTGFRGRGPPMPACCGESATPKILLNHRAEIFRSSRLDHEVTPLIVGFKAIALARVTRFGQVLGKQVARCS